MIFSSISISSLYEYVRCAGEKANSFQTMTTDTVFQTQTPCIILIYVHESNCRFMNFDPEDGGQVLESGFRTVVEEFVGVDLAEHEITTLGN